MWALLPPPIHALQDGDDGSDTGTFNAIDWTGEVESEVYKKVTAIHGVTRKDDGSGFDLAMVSTPLTLFDTVTSSL